MSHTNSSLELDKDKSERRFSSDRKSSKDSVSNTAMTTGGRMLSTSSITSNTGDMFCESRQLSAESNWSQSSAGSGGGGGGSSYATERTSTAATGSAPSNQQQNKQPPPSGATPVKPPRPPLPPQPPKEVLLATVSAHAGLSISTSTSSSGGVGVASASTQLSPPKSSTAIPLSQTRSLPGNQTAGSQTSCVSTSIGGGGATTIALTTTTTTMTMSSSSIHHHHPPSSPSPRRHAIQEQSLERDAALSLKSRELTKHKRTSTIKSALRKHAHLDILRGSSSSSDKKNAAEKQRSSEHLNTTGGSGDQLVVNSMPYELFEPPVTQRTVQRTKRRGAMMSDPRRQMSADTIGLRQLTDEYLHNAGVKPMSSSGQCSLVALTTPTVLGSTGHSSSSTGQSGIHSNSSAAGLIVGQQPQYAIENQLYQVGRHVIGASTNSKHHHHHQRHHSSSHKNNNNNNNESDTEDTNDDNDSLSNCTILPGNLPWQSDVSIQCELLQAPSNVEPYETTGDILKTIAGPFRGYPANLQALASQSGNYSFDSGSHTQSPHHHHHHHHHNHPISATLKRGLTAISQHHLSPVASVAPTAALSVVGNLKKSLSNTLDISRHTMGGGQGSHSGNALHSQDSLPAYSSLRNEPDNEDDGGQDRDQEDNRSDQSSERGADEWAPAGMNATGSTSECATHDHLESQEQLVSTASGRNQQQVGQSTSNQLQAPGSIGAGTATTTLPCSSYESQHLSTSVSSGPGGLIGQLTSKLARQSSKKFSVSKKGLQRALSFDCRGYKRLDAQKQQQQAQQHQQQQQQQHSTDSSGSQGSKNFLSANNKLRAQNKSSLALSVDQSPRPYLAQSASQVDFQVPLLPYDRMQEAIVSQRLLDPPPPIAAASSHGGAASDITSESCVVNQQQREQLDADQLLCARSSSIIAGEDIVEPQRVYSAQNQPNFTQDTSEGLRHNHHRSSVRQRATTMETPRFTLDVPMIATSDANQPNHSTSTSTSRANENEDITRENHRRRQEVEPMNKLDGGGDEDDDLVRRRHVDDDDEDANAEEDGRAGDINGLSINPFNHHDNNNNNPFASGCMSNSPSFCILPTNTCHSSSSSPQKHTSSTGAGAGATSTSSGSGNHNLSSCSNLLTANDVFSRSKIKRPSTMLVSDAMDQVAEALENSTQKQRQQQQQQLTSKTSIRGRRQAIVPPKLATDATEASVGETGACETGQLVDVGDENENDNHNDATSKSATGSRDFCEQQSLKLDAAEEAAIRALKRKRSGGGGVDKREQQRQQQQHHQLTGTEQNNNNNNAESGFKRLSGSQTNLPTFYIEATSDAQTSGTNTADDLISVSARQTPIGDGVSSTAGAYQITESRPDSQMTNFDSQVSSGSSTNLSMLSTKRGEFTVTSPNGLTVSFGSTRGRRRSSIAVIPQMQICPGDLLVYSKQLIDRMNQSDEPEPPQFLAIDGKKYLVLIQASRNELLCSLEDVLSTLQPSTFVDEQLSHYKGMTWNEFLYETESKRSASTDGLALLNAQLNGLDATGGGGDEHELERQAGDMSEGLLLQDEWLQFSAPTSSSGGADVASQQQEQQQRPNSKLLPKSSAMQELATLSSLTVVASSPATAAQQQSPLNNNSSSSTQVNNNGIAAIGGGAQLQMLVSPTRAEAANAETTTTQLQAAATTNTTEQRCESLKVSLSSGASSLMATAMSTPIKSGTTAAASVTSTTTTTTSAGAGAGTGLQQHQPRSREPASRSISSRFREKPKLKRGQTVDSVFRIPLIPSSPLKHAQQHQQTPTAHLEDHDNLSTMHEDEERSPSLTSRATSREGSIVVRRNRSASTRSRSGSSTTKQQQQAASTQQQHGNEAATVAAANGTISQAQQQQLLPTNKSSNNNNTNNLATWDVGKETNNNNNNKMLLNNKQVAGSTSADQDSSFDGDDALDLLAAGGNNRRRSGTNHTTAGQQQHQIVQLQLHGDDNATAPLTRTPHQIVRQSSLSTISSTITRTEQKRQRALWDLFQSECAFFFDHLMTLKNVYMEPLKKIQVEGFAMFADPDVLFGNLDELCCGVYDFCKEFLYIIMRTLKTRPEELNATDVLIKLYKKNPKIDHLRGVYHRYTLNYINALTYLESLRRQVEFVEFEKWASRDTRCKKLQLTDLLVAPVQHIMRVPIILKDIESHTEHVRDRDEIRAILSIEEASLRELDDKMRWLKNFERLLEIQKNISWPNVLELDVKLNIPEFLKEVLSKQPCEKLIVSPRRQIVHEGTLSNFDLGTRPCDMHVILFDDMLLITRRKKGLTKKASTVCKTNSGPSIKDDGSFKYIVYKQPLSLDRFYVHDVQNVDAQVIGMKNMFVFIVMNRFQQIIYVHTFSAPSDDIKQTWLFKIRKTAERWKKNQSNNSQEQQQQQQQMPSTTAQETKQQKHESSTIQHTSDNHRTQATVEQTINSTGRN